MNILSVCIAHLNKRVLYIEIEKRNVLHDLFEYVTNKC